MVSTGKSSISIEDIQSKVTDASLIWFYLGIEKIPCFITSPLRKDKRASFGLYSRDNIHIHWTDLATKEGGGVYDLLSLLWHLPLNEVLLRINRDLKSMSNSTYIDTMKHSSCSISSISNIKLECKIRKWRQYDIDYWASFGITLPWLKYAEVYPISHKILISDNRRIVFGADKYAYAFIEHKEGIVTLKIYQPFNTLGFKWSNKHDRSVISLWTKVPEIGEKIVICSSLKDALCFWENTGIPAIAPQGEGYDLSNTAISELKRRFKTIYILFDNDKAGIEDSLKLSKRTGFINVTLPQFYGGKDVSDLMKVKGKEQFLSIIKEIFNPQGYTINLNDCPY